VAHLYSEADPEGKSGHGSPIQFGNKLWPLPSTKKLTWHTEKHIKLAPP